MLLPSSPTIDPPRVAFAVSRAVGPAVVRNRLRRRIRAHLAEVRRTRPDRLPGGAWLVALSPAARELASAELCAEVDGCLDRLTTAGSGR